MVPRRWVVAAALTLSAAGTTSCSDTVNNSELDGDCTARVRLDGVIFRPHNLTIAKPPLGEPLGDADVVDCGEGMDAPRVGHVRVFAIKGLPTDLAVAVRRGAMGGAYIVEGSSPSDWPELVEPRYADR